MKGMSADRAAANPAGPNLVQVTDQNHDPGALWLAASGVASGVYRQLFADDDDTADAHEFRTGSAASGTRSRIPAFLSITRMAGGATIAGTAGTGGRRVHRQLKIPELFESSLALIDHIVATVCRRARMQHADAEDFASSARIALMENDYAILRKYAGRSTFPAYLTVVVQRLLLDYRTHALGRWRPSREAERHGEAGVLLETLLQRDRRSLDEALPLVQALDATVTRERAAEMASRFPVRIPRPRPVELLTDLPVAAADASDERIVDADRRTLSARASRVIRDALAALPDEDAMILRFRYGSGMSIADISRMLRIPQRPLYRRLDSLIARLRAALETAGLDFRDLVALIGESHEMDFGLADRSYGSKSRCVVRNPDTCSGNEPAP